MANATQYSVIYDGKCNLCVTFVQVLEGLDKGERFQYISMQDQAMLTRFNITGEDCEMGMILVDNAQPNRRWQGSQAAEEIGQIFPLGAVFVNAYRSLPGLKWAGERVYEQIRDNRYALFGKRDQIYRSVYPCEGACGFDVEQSAAERV